MSETCEREIYDPADLVKDLADKIGIHQLYAIAKDMGGECDKDELAKKLALVEANNQWLKDRVCRLEGENDGLRFAIKCNGISGAEVR